MTKRTLAARTGLSYWRVARILRGVNHPTQVELDALRKAIFAESDQ